MTNCLLPRSGMPSAPQLSFHTSSMDRGGNRFVADQETRLYPWAHRAAVSLPGASKGVVLVAEMAGPLGVPDFVAVVGGKSHIAERLATGIAPLTSELDCTILAHLYPSRPRSLEAVAAELQMSAHTLKPRFAALVRRGAVERLATGGFHRNPAFTPGGTFYALETKLGNWQRAVRQARGYRTWTSNYVLILDEIGPRAREAVLAEVSADRAGLVLGDRWVRKPSPRTPSKTNRMLSFEYLMAGLGAHHPSSVVNWSSPMTSGSIH